jgi:putative FmdB family regulatory protein
MPTYEYSCVSCGNHLDVVQAFRDDPLTTCPTCEGTLRKVYGNIGVVFKGSGFYKTDSRTPGATASSKPTEGDASAPDGASKGSDAPEKKPTPSAEPTKQADTSSPVAQLSSKPAPAPT